jgi:hypothetical protein
MKGKCTSGNFVLERKNLSRTQWYTSIIPACRNLKHQDHKFEASMSYKQNCLNKQIPTPSPVQKVLGFLHATDRFTFQLWSRYPLGISEILSGCPWGRSYFHNKKSFAFPDSFSHKGPERYKTPRLWWRHCSEGWWNVRLCSLVFWIFLCVKF